MYTSSHFYSFSYLFCS
ncbi:hypothetical protein DCAR_0727618 [Daucus carota subsp. sativus]|uniref:Uncharacterized protein n=1 Tax=Daucus carota subsp. sativus TaxID=79200 RepID=A0AAF1B9G3_DAUCS|nr:hypothetical protein DCAR_0727618 [Daucus carota subsp. sativus]